MKLCVCARECLNLTVQCTFRLVFCFFSLFFFCIHCFVSCWCFNSSSESNFISSLLSFTLHKNGFGFNVFFSFKSVCDGTMMFRMIILNSVGSYENIFSCKWKKPSFFYSKRLKIIINWRWIHNTVFNSIVDTKKCVSVIAPLAC